MNSLITTVRRSRSLKALVPSMLSAALVLYSIAPGFAERSHKNSVPASNVPGISSVALFSASNNAGTDGAIAASSLDTALKLALVESGSFEVTTFSPRLPSIDRALNVDNTLTSADIQQPVTDPGVALKIARVMGTDGYLLDEVDAYQEDSTTHAITVTVSGILYYSSTGASVRTFAVTGAATPTTPDQGAGAVLQLAVQNAASQIVTSINASSGKSQVPQSSYHQSSRGSILLVLLTGALIGVIAHNNYHPAAVSPYSTTTVSSSGTTSSSGTPPPPP